MDDLKSVIRGLEICSAGDVNSNRRACTDCPFYPAGYTGCSAKRLLSAALEIMKAQEPRVLTLEEVKDRIGEAIYFESRGTYMGKVVFPILPALFTSHGLMRYVHPQSSHYSELGLHDYGIVWRCWTSRPTDEQREEAPWPC